MMYIITSSPSGGDGDGDDERLCRRERRDICRRRPRPRRRGGDAGEEGMLARQLQIYTSTEWHIESH